MAGVLFVLPSLAILIALTWIYLAFGGVPAVAGVLYGIKPAVTAIVVICRHRIGSRALRSRSSGVLRRPPSWQYSRSTMPFPHRAGGRCYRYLGGRVAPGRFKTGGGTAPSTESFGPALIDDHTPAPAGRGSPAFGHCTSRSASSSGRCWRIPLSGLRLARPFGRRWVGSSPRRRW